MCKTLLQLKISGWCRCLAILVETKLIFYIFCPYVQNTRATGWVKLFQAFLLFFRISPDRQGECFTFVCRLWGIFYSFFNLYIWALTITV